MKLTLQEGPHSGLTIKTSARHDDFFVHEGHTYRVVASNPNIEAYAQYCGLALQKKEKSPEKAESNKNKTEKQKSK